MPNSKNFKNKLWWYLPEYVDRWRVIPRLLMGGYVYFLYTVIMWFIGLPAPTLEQAGFASAIVTIGAGWFQIYIGSAPKMTSELLNHRINVNSNFDRSLPVTMNEPKEFNNPLEFEENICKQCGIDLNDTSRK